MISLDSLFGHPVREYRYSPSFISHPLQYSWDPPQKWCSAAVFLWPSCLCVPDLGKNKGWNPKLWAAANVLKTLMDTEIVCSSYACCRLNPSRSAFSGTPIIKIKFLQISVQPRGLLLRNQTSIQNPPSFPYHTAQALVCNEPILPITTKRLRCNYCILFFYTPITAFVPQERHVKLYTSGFFTTPHLVTMIFLSDSHCYCD